ncbi:MAG TPA: DNA recombination protein RmuC [Gemmatimonadales bacterium]|nr:DNA recombination protein RmuC [Gemmatimonadales bacterium]
MTTAVLVILGVAAGALIAVLARRGGGDSLLQQQLIELRSRLDALLGAQQALPRTLAEGTAEQARALADVRERLGELGAATKRLEQVGEAVVDVQQLLQVPRLRGTLGEVWLEELLHQILPLSAYGMQHTFRSGERVDAVVHLGERFVPIDAKFPLEAYQRMLGATGADRDRERRAFARSLKGRIDEIADKYIRPEEGSYEFALMYLPAESVYYEATLGTPADEGTSVFSYALARRVIPVSPHTFYAYLLVILHGLKGMKVEEHAREIQAELGGLGQQFGTFWAAFEKVGAHLGNAAKQFEESAKQATKLEARFERVAGAAVERDGLVDRSPGEDRSGP